MPTTCNKCGAPLVQGDAFCGACGAPVSTTSEGKVDLQRETAWRSLLDPGEEPIFVLDKAAVRVAVKKTRTRSNERGQTTEEEYVPLLPSWQLHKVDTIVLTGQRLFCMRKGNILAPGTNWIAEVPLIFAVDPNVVGETVETDRKVNQDIRSARRRDWQERRRKGLFNTMFSPGTTELLEATATAVLMKTNRLPPVVRVWEKAHFLRPLSGFWTGLIALGGCLTFGCLLLPVQLILSGISLPFRLRPWRGIQISLKPTQQNPRYADFEITIFNRDRATQLLLLLQPKANAIRKILEEKGALIDASLRGAVRSVAQAFKEYREDARRDAPNEL